MADKCGMDTVLLEEYAEGMLNQAEQLLLEHHVRNCDSCRKKLTEMKLMFWEIGNIAKQPISYPDELKELGARMISALPLKRRTARDTLKTVFRSQKKLWSGIIYSVVPVAGKSERIEKEPSSAIRAFSGRLASRIGMAGKNMIKRQIGHIFGGAR